MTPSDEQPFAQALVMTAEIFAEPLSEARIAGYFDALGDLELEAVLHGLARMRRESTFFPKPADIRAVSEGTPADQGEIAWGRFLHALEHVGTYRSVDFGDAVLHATIEAVFGGWVE